MEVGYELIRVQKFDKSLLLAARTSSGLIGQRAAHAARKGEQIWTVPPPRRDEMMKSHSDGIR